VKAISPVIATVIIVAVAIAISIAVALWMTGLTTTFTGLEKLEIINAYAEVSQANVSNTNVTYWIIHLKVKNTGTKAVTIDGIYVNNKPGNISNATVSPSGWNLDPGDEKDITFNLTSNTTTQALNTIKPLVNDKFNSGQTVSIVVHTASGGQYPATITLP